MPRYGPLKDIVHAYLANIAANLTHSGKKLQTCHPFFRAQSSLSCKVMEMSDQPFENIGQTWIWALGVDTDSIFGNVVDSQIFHWWNVRFSWIHCICFPAAAAAMGILISMAVFLLVRGVGPEERNGNSQCQLQGAESSCNQ